MVGFFSHLLLDEICSVDLKGARVNKAFGTAIKLWAPSPWTTLAMYGLLSYLAWMAIQRWPIGPYARSTCPRSTCRSGKYAAGTWSRRSGRRRGRETGQIADRKLARRKFVRIDIIGPIGSRGDQG